MTKPITREEFDLVEIDAALEAEKAEKQATRKKRCGARGATSRREVQAAH